MGWSVDRTKDGESMSQQRESEKMRKISQASQVRHKVKDRNRNKCAIHEVAVSVCFKYSGY